MKRKTIRAILIKKHNDFLGSIEDEAVRKLVDRNSIITGGCIVSMLLGEQVGDFDYYFKDQETALAVAQYYANKFNAVHNTDITAHGTEEGRIRLGGKALWNRGPQGDPENPEDSEIIDADIKSTKTEEVERYRPLFITENAITLSNKIQLIIRFFGTVEEIHENFDYVHTTCSWDSRTNEVTLPPAALESIMTKTLVYMGSKYPVCSIIRSRKFIQRGWTINAGNYVKMALQVSELDLKTISVLRDQLVGVDAVYFTQVLDSIEKKMEEDPGFKVDNSYLFAILDKIFN